MTLDIDIVIELKEDLMDSFIRIFNEGFYISRETVKDEFKQNGMFNRFLIGAELINFGRLLVVSNIKKLNSEISDSGLKIAVLKGYYENCFSKEEFEQIVQSLLKYTTRIENSKKL